MGKLIDHSGRRYGHLVAERVVGKQPGSNNAIWLCRCDCGNYCRVQSGRLPRSVACGCHLSRVRQREVARSMATHGHASRSVLGENQRRSPTYSSWMAMRQRCNKSSHKHYPNYGGRGVRVCDAWNTSFDAFLADLGERPPGMTLDRLDNDRGYEPGNVKWSTSQEQSRNKRTTKLEAHEPEQLKWLRSLGYPLRQIAEFFGVSKAHVVNICAGRP